MHASSRDPDIYMYHVTNVDGDCPMWNEIRLCVPNDKYFDPKLKGLPVACFTTTLYLGGLPDRSPYPRGSSASEHWRVRMPFDPQEYRVFKIDKVDRQVHLLCLKTSGSKVERCLANLLHNTSPGWELHSEDQYNGYFPGGKANDYEYGPFVNVHFIHPVKIDPHDQYTTWDKVPHDSGARHGPLTNEYRGKPNKDLLVQWANNHVKILYKHHSVPEEVARLLKKLFQAIKQEAQPLFTGVEVREPGSGKTRNNGNGNGIHEPSPDDHSAALLSR